jgi:hypothetical protein
MDIAEEVIVGLVLHEVVTHLVRTALFSPGHYVEAQGWDSRGHMGAQDVDRAELTEDRGHLLVGDLPRRL